MNYLILVSLAKPNRATADKIVSNLKKIADQTIAPAWIDSAYIGIPIETDKCAAEIWSAATVGMNEVSDLRDLLIVELGRDWMARKDARSSHWLMTHLGLPLRQQLPR